MSCRHRTRRGRPRRTGRPRTPRGRDRACGRSASPSSPIARRWPASAPSRSRTGSSRIPGRCRAGRRGPPGWRSRAAATRSGGDPAQAFGTHGRTPAPSVVDAMNPTAPRATTPGPIQRSHRDSTMTVDLLRRTRRLAGGGRGHDPRRRPLSEAYPGLRSADVASRRSWSAKRAPGRSRRRRRGAPERAHPKVRERGAQPTTRAWAVPVPAVVPCHSTLCGREVGEIPTQSRYGERSHESASPVADHTVHARTFERKVGRTRATDRLDPSFDACRSEGFAIRRDPSESIPLRRFPCSRRSHRPREPRRPAGCRPSSRPSS